MAFTLNEASDAIARKLAENSWFQARIAFDFGDDGRLFIDATQTPPAIHHRMDGDPQVTLRCTIDVFTALVRGEKDPNIAFMMGQLKVDGSMGVALKLNQVLEG